MVGGEVIEVAILKDRVFIDCRDRTYERDTCAIYVERSPNALRVRPGDMVWWQGYRAFWTPKANRLTDEESKKKGHKAGVDYEIELIRIGYSGVDRPADDDILENYHDDPRAPKDPKPGKAKKRYARA